MRSLATITASFLFVVAFAGCGTGHVTLVPATRPSAGAMPSGSPGAGVAPVPSASPNAGGAIAIDVPTPGPLSCSPSPVALKIRTIVIVACSERGSVAPVSATVVDPTIATIQISPAPAANTFGTTFFVTGLRSGTTTLALSNAIGVSGSIELDVTSDDP